MNCVTRPHSSDAHSDDRSIHRSSACSVVRPPAPPFDRSKVRSRVRSVDRDGALSWPGEWFPPVASRQLKAPRNRSPPVEATAVSILHEGAGHWLRQHLDLMVGGADRKLWNIAGDMEIDDDIRSMGFDDFPDGRGPLVSGELPLILTQIGLRFLGSPADGPLDLRPEVRHYGLLNLDQLLSAREARSCVGFQA